VAEASTAPTPHKPNRASSGSSVTNKWKMQVKDLTTGRVTAGPFRIPPGTSVEVIHECPTVGGSLANLAKTGKVTQDPAYYSTATNTSPTVPLMKAASGGRSTRSS
jgi:hypothetical protein